MASKFKRSTAVQTVMLPRDRYTPTSALAWLRKAGFKGSGMEPGGKSSKYLHYRQRDPKSFAPGTFRTIELGNGVKATIGIPERRVGRAAGRRAARSAVGRMNPSIPQEVLNAPVGTILVETRTDPGRLSNYTFYVVTHPGRMAYRPSDAGLADWPISAFEVPLQIARLGNGKLTSDETHTKHAVNWRAEQYAAQRAGGRSNPGRLRRNHDKATAEVMLQRAARVAGTPGRSPIFYARAEGRMAALSEDSTIPSSMRRDAADYRSALFQLSNTAHFDERRRLLSLASNPRDNPGLEASYIHDLLAAAQPGDSLNLPCPSGGTYAYFIRAPGGWRLPLKKGGQARKASARLITETAADFLHHGWVFALVRDGATRRACR